MSANTKFEILSDIVAKGGNLLVACFCGHRSVVDAEKLDRWYRCHGWSTRLHMVPDHLRCTACGKRPERIKPTAKQPHNVDRFPHNEEEWARLVKRLRR